MTAPATVLVAEDEGSMRRILQLELEQEGWRVLLAENGASARDLLRREPVDLLITDMKMGPVSGMDLLRESRQTFPDMPVIMMTAFGTVETAVEAMQLGARDYVIKPFEMDDLRLKARRALAEYAMRAENRLLRAQLAEHEAPVVLVGNSPAIRQVLDLMDQVADTPSTVLITGESGTGKEVVARLLHQRSPRAHKPFVVVNCAALSESLADSELFGHVKGAFTSAASDRIGRFELADGGTIFLDELALIPLNLQAKLLRVIQEKAFERVGSTDTMHVDVRIIGATNTDLRNLIDTGAFREDLYYRLHVVDIHLPPLRARLDDVPALVDHFLAKHAAKLGRPQPTFAPRALEALGRYHWPGNVRELENVVERAILLARDAVVDLDQLSIHLGGNGAPPPPGAVGAEAVGFGQPGFSLTRVTEDLERDCIQRALAETAGNKSRAADLLGVTRKILRYKIGKYGLEAPNGDGD